MPRSIYRVAAWAIAPRTPHITKVSGLAIGQRHSAPSKGSRFSPRLLLKFSRNKAQATPSKTGNTPQSHAELGVSAKTEARVKRPSLLKKAFSSPISTIFSGSRGALSDVEDTTHEADGQPPGKVYRIPTLLSVFILNSTWTFSIYVLRFVAAFLFFRLLLYF